MKVPNRFMNVVFFPLALGRRSEIVRTNTKLLKKTGGHHPRIVMPETA